MIRNIYKIEGELYITQDEFIIEGDWFKRANPNLTPEQNNKIFKCSYLHNDGTIQPVMNQLHLSKWKQEWCEKIILTTDSNLIADGVKAIPRDYYDEYSKDFERASLEDFIDEYSEEEIKKCFNKNNL